jgi:hypothetical protein
VVGIETSIEERERAIVVLGIIGLACTPLDDQALSAAVPSRNFWIHVVLTIAPLGKSTFAVFKHPPTDVSR